MPIVYWLPVIGTTVSHYRVIRKIGGGGMGEVFEAEDTRLGRRLALKFLPDSFSGDPLALERFQREARAASALSHPGICTIFDVGEWEGRPFLALELLEGATLQKRIARQPVPFDDLLDWAVQIGSALAAAHAKGIVHRDIKPANIFISTDGQPKILDFGLAKQVGPRPADLAEAPTVAMEGELTSPGSAVGTASYMSPEQARGQEVDARTDLFSFGVVLYEMATGRLPFPGDTIAVVFDGILNRVPESPVRLNPALPAEFDTLVRKAIEKDREVRYQSASDLVADLKRLRRDTGRTSATQAVAAASPAGRLRWIWPAACAALMAAAAIAGFAFLRSPKKPAAVGLEWRQITSFPDAATAPALSPDGRMLAFTRGDNWFVGRNEIYVKMLPDGQPVQITRDGRPKMYPSFSPDGSRIAYTVGGWDTWVVPVLAGGEPRLMLPNAEGLNWIDSQRVMFSEIKKGRHMAVGAAAESRAEYRNVYAPPSENGMAHFSALSPDRKQVLIVEMESGWGPCRLVPFDGGSPGRQVGPIPSQCTAAAWAPDGKWMYFSAKAGQGSHIWRQAVGGDKPEQLTFGPTEEQGVTVSPDGRSLYTSAGTSIRSVWVHDAKGDRQVSGEGDADAPAFTAEGTKLYYTVVLRGNPGAELWVSDLETGRSEIALPGVKAPHGWSLSPDGKSVAYRDSAFDLWIAPLDRRSPPRKLSARQSRGVQLVASGDVFYYAQEGNGSPLYRLQPDGTERKALDLPGDLFRGFSVSPDGRWVACTPEDLAAQAYPLAGGKPVVVCPYCFVTWGPDGRSMLLHFAPFTNEGDVSVVLPYKDGALPALPSGGVSGFEDAARLPGAQVIPSFDAAVAGSSYAYVKDTPQANLFRITLP